MAKRAWLSGFLIVCLIAGVGFYTVMDASKTMPDADVPDAQTNAPTPLIAEIDFEDGAEYVLLLHENGTARIIEQVSALVQIQGDLAAQALSWHIDFTREHGAKEPWLTLYRDGTKHLIGELASLANFDLDSLSEVAQPVEYHHYSDSRHNIEAKLAALHRTNAPRVVLLTRPDPEDVHDTVLVAYLPTLWVSADIPAQTIYDQIDALLIPDPAINPERASYEFYTHKIDEAIVLDQRYDPILDAGGAPVSISPTVSFYSPRVGVFCSNINDCKTLFPNLHSVANQMLMMRDTDLLDSLKHPLYPEFDGNGHRELWFNFGVLHDLKIEISEAHRTISYYEVVQ